MIYKNFTIQNRGYTLLFAVLVSSVLLGIGISILSISKKEFLIATSARDSSSAFYAADSGVECALFADQSGNFNTAVDNTASFKCAVPYSFIVTPAFAPGNQVGTFTFYLGFGSPVKACATVSVTKQRRTDGSIKTIIDSSGYNLGWVADVVTPATKGTCIQASPKRVERAIVYSY